MMLSDKIKELENLHNKNSNIIKEALNDEDFIIENLECNIEDYHNSENIFYDDNMEVEDKKIKLISLLEKNKYPSTFFLFSLSKEIEEDFNLKKYLNEGYKSKNPLITFLYGLYILDLYFENNKDTDLLKAQKIFEDAYSLDIPIAKIPLNNLEISIELESLRKKNQESLPVNKQITINDEKRNIYLLKGVVVDRKVITSHSTETSGGGSNGFGGSNPIHVKTTTHVKATFNIIDNYGNEKVYSHPKDIDVRINNEVILINLDNKNNTIGIYNKDTGIAYYNDDTTSHLTSNFLNALPFIFFILGFLLFFNFWGWNYIHCSTGFFIAIGGIILGGIIFKITEAIRSIFNKLILKKLIKDMWKFLN